MTAREKLKYEIAEELGLLDRVNSDGWKSLTARESGRIGGILAKREKDAREKPR
ncbi:MAG: alpha/beta-type small acid-soluble spore protein [Defluviitaleaceae bacterium]|nr:alpha/beta-type small acid-soluble spore protein [Defluviitaleaceae bacterium]MCL2835699.1 alpha/beta-type small acid-soluble spore protein [Defluviitaleaceae bacterium]